MLMIPALGNFIPEHPQTMARTPIFFIAATLLITAGFTAARANALQASAASVAETLPDGAVVTGLEVQPARIDFESKYDAAQLIVLARLGSGELADVTRMANIRATGEVAEV